LLSARKSYYQLLFKALDAPFLTNFWDFQTKITHKIHDKTTINFIGIGATDDSRSVTPKEITAEKLFNLNSAPIIQQWNYTGRLSLKRNFFNGFWNLALSRTHFNNDIQKYEDGENPSPANQTLDFVSNEIETKLRLTINKYNN